MKKEHAYMILNLQAVLVGIDSQSIDWAIPLGMEIKGLHCPFDYVSEQN